MVKKDIQITKRKYPYVAKQDWSNILFLNWPVPLEFIRRLVPEPFIIDTYDGKAWISFVIFQAKNSHLRLMPQLLSLPPVTQINVRTYVKYPHSLERGVYFFKLNVKSILAVIGAKSLFHLPFHYLQTKTLRESDAITVQGKQKHDTVFSVTYIPTTEKIQSGLGNFLTERYCIWNIKRKKVIKVPILHSLWDLQKVRVKVNCNKLLPNDILAEPIAFYNPYKRTKLYPYEAYGYIN